MTYILNNDELGLGKIRNFYNRLRDENGTFHISGEIRTGFYGIFARIDLPKFIGSGYELNSCDDFNISLISKSFEPSSLEIGFYSYSNIDISEDWTRFQFVNKAQVKGLEYDIRRLYNEYVAGILDKYPVTKIPLNNNIYWHLRLIDTPDKDKQELPRDNIITKYPEKVDNYIIFDSFNYTREEHIQLEVSKYGDVILNE